jgi:hypothetical protein
LPWAIVVAYRRQADLVVLSASIFVVYLLINAGYVYWDGGFSTGPRHIVPSLAFALLPIALAYDAASRPLRYLIVALVGAGLLANLVAAGATMTTPQDVPGVVLFTYLWPHFYDFWVSQHPARLLFDLGILGLIAVRAFSLLPRRSEALAPGV